MVNSLLRAVRADMNSRLRLNSEVIVEGLQGMGVVRSKPCHVRVRVIFKTLSGEQIVEVIVGCQAVTCVYVL